MPTTTFTRNTIASAIAQIAEPGDRLLSRVLDTYPGDRVDAYGTFLTDLENDNVTLSAGSDANDTDSVTLWKQRFSRGEIATSERTMARDEIAAIFPGEAEWPTGLDVLEDQAPRVLFGRGDISLLTNDAARIGVVGARAATGYGEHVTMELVQNLVDKNATIISGAAYGIDGMAHRAALASGGNTIAVVAGGLDRRYPSGHESLIARIEVAGLVLSQMAPGMPPTKIRFLHRNSIIAGIADAIVVAEAGARSGSLGTAHYAHEINTPVGAIPGPITSAASYGSNGLIQKGTARLIADAADVVDLLNHRAKSFLG